jgi:hypothetical protein
MMEGMITKRQLGIGFILLGLLAIIATFAVDWLGAGNFQGIGPAQRLTLIGAALLILVGITLLPLGDKPA